MQTFVIWFAGMIGVTDPTAIAVAVGVVSVVAITLAAVMAFVVVMACIGFCGRGLVADSFNGTT